jgi:hypothetical protein
MKTKKRKELDKSKCPEFDYFNFEPILKWAGAEVKFSDKFWHAKTGKITKRPEMAHWTLLWQHGFIGFDCISTKKERKKARMAGALFIYLWCKGVSASIADNCASLYARNVVMRRV